MDLSEVKTLIQAQGEAWEEFKKANDALLKAKAEGKAVGDLETKVSTINGAIDKLQEQLDTVQKIAQRPAADADGDQKLADEVKSFNLQRAAWAKPGTRIEDLPAEHYAAYKSAFFRMVRGEERHLSNDEMKALQAGVDSDGGYLLPSSTVGRVVAKVYELSPIRQIADVQPISGPALEGVIDNDEAAAGGWVSETGTRSESNTPTVGKYRLEPFEMYAMPKATQTMLDDGAIDVEAWLAGKVANKFARYEADAFINGNGVGKPRGFAAYTTAATADASRAWGVIEHIKTGANGAFHTTQADPLFDLLGAIKTAYLANARWVTRREVITAIRKFKTTTTLEYIWQPGLQMGQPDRLLGYPIVIAPDMPALGTGSLSMAFGDFREAYTVVDKIGIRTLRDPFTAKPYILFYSTKRVGGGVLNFEAIKFIQFAA